ncbi:hypothetical protein [Streptomyces sp. NPDC047000]|uniref:hypothetical protein n=1 Tax=Streptomyces sp. NPDC047000 TaxID=3155474 RepID=UPI0033C7C119
MVLDQILSPPGYGETTLMKYVADRLGLTVVKVSGPALDHAVTSLDPAKAPNATARQETRRSTSHIDPLSAAAIGIGLSATS